MRDEIAEFKPVTTGKIKPDYSLPRTTTLGARVEHTTQTDKTQSLTKVRQGIENQKKVNAFLRSDH